MQSITSATHLPSHVNKHTGDCDPVAFLVVAATVIDDTAVIFEDVKLGVADTGMSFNESVGDRERDS